MVAVAEQLDLQETIQHVFDAQKKNAQNIALSSADERIDKLKKLQKWIEDNEQKIKNGLHEDFKKHPDEVMIGEVLGVSGEIKHSIKNLKKWMRLQKQATPLTMLGSSSYVKLEPKGTVLIIAPWNYPFQLLVKPLVHAIAAGNTAIVKPSELTPHNSAVLRDMVAELFAPEEVALFEGDATVAEQLLALPFDHIFFTGSPNVGKVVMTAAAKHLASVTLELGGKSPCIVDETADLKTSAERIAWGKCINNGQTCIAPDYLFVHEKVREELLNELKSSIEKMYNSDGKGIEKSDYYCRIVNKRHFNRVKGLIDDAVLKGAKVEYGGQMNEADRYISPTILSDVSDEMQVMHEEIFGPVLPIQTFQTMDEVLNAINKRPKPLALYLMSMSKHTVEYVLNRTSAGGTVINDLLIHNGNTEVPFGGVNNSGIGKSNGYWGFKEFSNERAVMKQIFGSFKIVYPPYTETTSKIVKFLVKWF